MSNIKKLLNVMPLLMTSLLPSSCFNGNSLDPNTSETVTASENSAIKAASEISNTSTQAENNNTVKCEAANDAEDREYIYSPPASALDVEFVRDKIIHKLEYTYYRNDGTAELPEFILSDMNLYADEVISNDGCDQSFEWIGVDMFDINSDGLDDYIVVGQIIDMPFVSKQEGDAPYMSIERIYVLNEKGGFDAIDFPASCGKDTIQNDHILSTRTNCYNEFIGSTYDGLLLKNFDGNSTYSETRTLSADYTWEYLDNSLLRITVCADGHENEIAVAKFLYDTDYTEHKLLYSSLPDGTPTVCDSGKFEFYIKLTEKAPEDPNDFWGGPIEVEYVLANNIKNQRIPK